VTVPAWPRRSALVSCLLSALGLVTATPRLSNVVTARQNTSGRGRTTRPVTSTLAAARHPGARMPKARSV
jgi:hypothetical protein